jgi:uncharacterized membrane protein
MFATEKLHFPTAPAALTVLRICLYLPQANPYMPSMPYMVHFLPQANPMSPMPLCGLPFAAGKPNPPHVSPFTPTFTIKHVHTMPTPQHKKSANIFLRMHPLQRILLSLAVSLIVYLATLHFHLNSVLTITLLWDTFALTFVSTSWIVFFTRPVADIIAQANKEDGSKAFVLISTIVTSFASMFAVMLLVLSRQQLPDKVALAVILAIAGMMLSWVMVHTIFTFHYAHLYYFKALDDTPNGEALNFPATTCPDYLDFAYYSFVIGMTFQVSDVNINSRLVRRTTLAHALLSFALNTFVVALTINLIAGLRG